MSLYSTIFIFVIVLHTGLNSENEYCKEKLDFVGNNITQIIERFTDLWSVSDWIELGFFSEEYICDINLHWLLFEPPDKSSFIVFAVIYLNIMLAGFFGNILVIFLFIRCKSLRTPGNTLIVNLAASDGMITLKTPIFIYNCFHMGPALGDIACRIYGFVGGLSGTVSIVTLSAISFDRYIMIKFPLNRAYSDLRVKICLIIVWLYGLTFSLIPVLDIGLGKYTYEGYLTSCSFDYLTHDAKERYFIFAFFIAAWVVPFVLITFSYVNIVKVVTARSAINKNSKDSFRHVKEENSKKQEIKLAVVVMCSICLWVVAWTPYSIVALLGIFDQQHLISPLSSMIPAVFCKTASCLNPFLYALSHPKFKKELRNMICGSARPREVSRIWSSQGPKRNVGSCRESSDVEEEVIELEVRSIGRPQQTSCETPSAAISVQGKIKRKPSAIELICLRPNFSNKSSAFRKMSRRWSANEKRSKEGD